MIIKSLGRKASAKITGGGATRTPFSNLLRYMTRDHASGKSQSVLWHGLYGDEGMSDSEIVAAFEENARLLKERKNGNVLYHEILSFSAGYQLREEALVRAVADIGQEYLRHRAANQLAFGAIHFDTDHIHLHLMISANAIGKTERTRLSKAEFADIQKTVEAFTLERYGDLAQTRIYGRDDRDRERLKTQTHEQAMRVRTGAPSRKEALKAKLHGFFERAETAAELARLLAGENLAFYARGRSTGVIVREADGGERRHRLSTLGLEAHYQRTTERLANPTRETSHPSHRTPSPPEKEIDMPEKTPWQMARDEPQPTTVEIVAEEFLTGQLHPAWHGKNEARDRYTDDILRRVKERNSEPRAVDKPTQDKGER